MQRNDWTFGYQVITVKEAAAAKLDQKQAELIELEDELADALVEITAEHEANAEKIEPVEIGLEKTDVRVAATRLVWVPVG